MPRNVEPLLRKALWALCAALGLGLPFSPAHAQDPDKCGYDESLAKAQLQILGTNWGYGYDSLLVDLQTWSQSRSVSIQSIGKSVENRDLWELTITDPIPPASPRRTVYVHARTHPNEVQSFWVTRAMIELLLSDDPFAHMLRTTATFHIVPMYNPDGVELELPRQNANGIDIESNWATSSAEPEVVALRNRFSELMWSDAPIEVALNMHSSVSCTRYFVFHDSVGTSETFAVLQRDFIAGIRSYFPEGIQPWNYFVSWRTGTALVYPESWFWLNYREAVMALTYEDMNCTTAGEYGKTASAIMRGLADYLGLAATAVKPRAVRPPLAIRLAQAYPHPLSLSRDRIHAAIIEYELPSAQYVHLALYDLLGRQIALLTEGNRPAGVSRASVRIEGLSSGTYFYRLSTPLGSLARPLLLTQ